MIVDIRSDLLAPFQKILSGSEQKCQNPPEPRTYRSNQDPISKVQAIKFFFGTWDFFFMNLLQDERG